MPRNRGKKLNEEYSLKDEINSTIAANEIAGMPKRKENFAASLLSHPDNKLVDIVIPDLETPGIIANACEMPIKKLSEYLRFFKFIKPFFEISAKYIKIAIKKEINAIDKFERRYILNKKGTNSLITAPTKTIGIVPIKTDQNIF